MKSYLIISITLILVFNSIGDTIINAGRIDGQIWKKSDSPYRINGNVYIDSLVIEAGVQVLFDNNYLFEVDSIFICNGFYNDSITFKANPNFSNSWEGISFKNCITPSQLNYCKIVNSDNHGLRVDGGTGPNVHNCSITGSQSNGLDIDRATVINVYNSKISNNLNGFHINRSIVKIYNSIISSNTGDAIWSIANSDSTIVTNSVIADNSGNGLLITSTGNMLVFNSIIYDNTIDINPGSGILIANYCNTTSLYSGTGNISVDPLFFDREFYNIDSLSLCIDAGKDIPLYNDLYFPPSQGAIRNDIGAYGGPHAGYWYPPLYIQTDTLHFGQVSFGDSLSLTINVKNYRDSIITIGNTNLLGVDTSAFSINVHNLTINILDSALIEVKFKPDGIGNSYALVELVTQYNGRYTIPVQGSGISAEIGINVGNINFGTVNFGDSKDSLIYIFNTGDDTLRIFDIYTLNSEFIACDTSLIINPGVSTDSINISFSPNSPGQKIDTLYIINNDPDEGIKKVPLRGYGKGPIIFVDSLQYNFGSVFLTTDTSLNVFINNNGNDTLFIDTLYFTENALNNFDLEVDSINFPLQLFAGNNYSLPVLYKPQSMGMDSAYLIIESDDAFNPSLNLKLKGKGIAPVFVLQDTLLDFGEVTFGASYTDSFIVRNIGNYILTIDPESLIVNGEDFGVIGVESYNIGENDSALIYVRFDAMLDSVNLAELQIVTNDPFNPKKIIQLRGETYAPYISKSTGLLDFGNVIKDSTIYQTFYLYNSGLGDLVIYEDSLFFDPPDSAYFSVAYIEKNPIVNNDSSLVQIRFTAQKAAQNNTILNIFSNDPDSSHIWINCNSFVLVPFIHLPQDSIEFGAIPLNTHITKLLTIYNEGYDNLTIYKDSLEILGNNTQFFSIDSIIGDTIIQPNDSLQLILEYSANIEGAKKAMLNIRSNDQVIPLVTVSLTGSSAAAEMVLSKENINFGTVPAESNIAETLTIRNLGSGSLIVYKDGFELIGDDSSFFNIPALNSDTVILPLDSMEIKIGLSTNTVGPKSSRLKIVSNVDSKTVNLSGLVFDNEPAIISLDEQHSSLELNQHENGNLLFDISTNFPTDSVLLFYKQGGKEGFDSAKCTNLSQMNIWGITIDSSWFAERGFEYFVRVYHGWRETDWPEKPKSLQVNFEKLEFPFSTQPEIYQKISIPFVSSNQSLKDLFEDNLGTYNNTQYRFFDCVNGSTYTEIKDMNVTLPPGKSLWLITKNEQNLDVEHVKSIITDTTYKISLHAGWNLVANPFAFPINWDDNEPNYELRFYDGTSTWPPVTIMEPYKGYAVKVDNPTEIFLEPNEYTGTTILNKPVLLKDYIWTINLKAEQKDIQDNFNLAGTKNNASDGIDSYDYSEPPPIGKFLAVYFLQKNETSGEIEKYSTNIKGESADGYIYNFEVTGNISGKKKLTLETNSVPNGYQYVVVNKQSKIKYPSDDIEFYSERSSLQLIVGSEKFVSEHSADYYLAPTKFILKQNYPNPFNPTTTIKYEIPEFSKLSINIYNILGQRVKTLLKNVEKEAGYYQVTWDGKNDAGSDVATGLYFLNFHSNQNTKSIKMILQR